MIITHFGVSRQKWRFIDKYRYQHKEFELIGITSFSGGPCDYWENIDYNISTGKIIYSNEVEDCDTGEAKIIKRENETFYFKLRKKPLLQNRNEVSTRIFSPKYKMELLNL